MGIGQASWWWLWITLAIRPVPGRTRGFFAGKLDFASSSSVPRRLDWRGTILAVVLFSKLFSSTAIPRPGV